MKKFWCWMAFLLPTLAYCQEVAAPAADPSTMDGVFKLFPELVKALQTQEALPVLVVLSNLLVALSKTSWATALWVKITKADPASELTDAGRTFLALFSGLLVVCVLSPSSTPVRTLGKGFGVGFAAIGMFHTWKHTLKKVFFKPRGTPTEPPPAPAV